MRRIFWFLNKYFMVPLFRLGFGPIFGNPLTGYIMVIKAIGRMSGKLYYTPVNYAIKDGSIYCISGGRRSSDWFLNLLATPEVEVILPGGAVFVRTEEFSDSQAKLAIVRQVLKNAGFAGFFEGYNPYKISDQVLIAKTADLPILRLQPVGIGNGASDPSGWAWITASVITILVILGLVAAL